MKAEAYVWFFKFLVRLLVQVRLLFEGGLHAMFWVSKTRERSLARCDMYSRVGSRRTLCRRTLRLENPQNLRTAQAGIFRLRTIFFLEYMHTRTMRRSKSMLISRVFSISCYIIITTKFTLCNIDLLQNEYSNRISVRFSERFESDFGQYGMYGIYGN